MLNFKEWLWEEISKVSVHKIGHEDNGTHFSHYYALRDQNDRKFADVDVHHRKTSSGKLIPHADVDISTGHTLHPDGPSLKPTVVGPKFNVPHHMLRPILNTIAKNHSDIKHFHFTRVTGANYKNGTPDNEHTVINPHYKE